MRVGVQIFMSPKHPGVTSTEAIASALQRYFTTQEQMELRIATFMVQVAEDLGLRVEEIPEIADAGCDTVFCFTNDPHLRIRPCALKANGKA
jgi:hypothetical protein